LVEALCLEIELQKDFLVNKNLSTIYFGGGTPSLLNDQELGLIFKTLESHFELNGLKEVTFEANPDDITISKLNTWKSFGINRISLGIQTFNDHILLKFNRSHNGEQSIKALDLVFENGFENTSADLIYAHDLLNIGLDESLLILENDITQLLLQPLQHISAYNLTIENQTVFGKWKKQGKLNDINEDLAAKHFEFLVRELEKKGFIQYEVSNFARNNNFAIHNSSYWKNEEYLGIGPSAHSYNGNSRNSNISNNSLYIKAINNRNIPAETEILSITEKVNDYILCGLRTIWGIDLKEISRISGEPLAQEFRDTLNDFVKKDLVILDNDQITISKKGRIISDYIASELFYN
jgi:oxygen-independent coproporphyrinogen-3 oxidase